MSDLLVALKAALPFLESCAEEQAIYGFFHGGDPRNFSPDGECCTEQEIENHRKACAEYELSGMGGPSCCEHRDGMIITHAPFGLGVNSYRDEEAVRALELAKTAIAKAEGLA